MAQQLRDGLIAAMLSVGVPPTEDVAWLETETPLRLTGIPVATGMETVGLTPFTVPADGYVSLREDLETVAIWSIAVVRADLDDTTVGALMDIAYGASEQLADAVSGAHDTGPANRLATRALPLHPAVAQWHQAHDSSAEGQSPVD